jgi:hypothetical protein
MEALADLQYRFNYVDIAEEELEKACKATGLKPDNIMEMVTNLTMLLDNFDSYKAWLESDACKMQLENVWKSKLVTRQ